MARLPLEKGSKKLLNAWAFYDWANSVYSLTVVSAVFPIFLGAIFRQANVEQVAVFGGSIARTPLISYVTAAAFVVIALITPLISGIADYLGNKKVFMKFFCYLGGLSCIGLYWFDLQSIYVGLVFYFLGVIGFWVSFAMSNSYLPDIAFPEQQDRISAWGFSLGYIGSVLLLLINLAMVLAPDVFGIADSPESPAAITAMKYSFVSVGIWWIGFSQYSFYYLPKGYRREGERHRIILNGFRELQGVWKQLTGLPRLKRYLGAFFVYSMAVQTVMLIAAYFGESEIAWGSDDQRTMGLIGSILIIQLVAVLGATLTARLSNRIGNITTLVIINAIWVAICIYAYFVKSPMEFYIAAGFVGMVMGGIQALSRSTYSKFLPETRDTTSFFSFYDVTEKIGIVIGMSIFGLVSQWNNSMRPATLILGTFFLIGILLLMRVPKENPEAA